MLDSAMEISTPQTKPRPFCFVLMPFDESFDDVYNIGIKESCEKAGAYCERVDEQIFDERILDRIYNQIAKADFVIADMTGRNANVFYEVGYAHALGKRTILLTKDAGDIPFDLKHFPHIIYGDSLSSLRNDLTKRVEFCVENPDDGISEIQNPFKVFINGQSAGDTGNVIKSKNGTIEFSITLENKTSSVIEQGEVSLSVIAPSGFSKIPELDYQNDSQIKSFQLPDRRWQINYPVERSFPGSFQKIIVAVFPELAGSFSWIPKLFKNPVYVHIRISTRAGFFEYPVSVVAQFAPPA